MSRKDKYLLVVAGVCILVTVGDWSYKTATDINSFVQYIGTIVATFSGVGLATYLSVRQFYSQARERDDARRQQLAQALGADCSQY
jgi:purine-cytosine permease-like protein